MTRIDNVLPIRRRQPPRLEGFVAAAYAFAVTLLVISLGRVPSSVPDMLHALRGIPAFALCFLTIARIWKSHRDTLPGAVYALSAPLTALIRRRYALRLVPIEAAP